MKMKCPHCGVKGTVSDSLIDKRVKCPKCTKAFQVVAEKPPVERVFEPVTESATETAGYEADTGASPGMTAQDEADLEEELAKIFDDMQRETPDSEEEPDVEEGDDFESLFGHIDPEDLSLSEEELQTQLEDIMDESCTVCGTIVGKSNKHELNGKVYCTNCLSMTEGDAETGRDLEVTKGVEQEGESSGMMKKLGAVLSGILIIALIIAAGYYFTQM
jgi:hypothetical protein